jgi:hypothetical protein
VSARGRRDERALIGEMKVWAAMRGLDFWLMFVSVTVVAGCGLSTINNIAQVSSEHKPQLTPNTAQRNISTSSSNKYRLTSCVPEPPQSTSCKRL